MVIKKSLLLFVFLLNLTFVVASIGVSPGIYEVDFKPNLNQVFHFEFFSDIDSNLKIYAQGDLAQYIELSTNELSGSGGVNVLLSLPSQVDIPGVHNILVGAEQTSSDSAGLRIVGNIRGVIKVKVPYPGKYAEIDFSTINANAGEDVMFTVNLKNLGKEVISSNSYIEIYDFGGNKKTTLYLGSNILNPTESVRLSSELKTKDYAAGNYKAIAVVEYEGKTIREEREFRLGELFVGIFNYTNELVRDKINRFDIDVESSWNDPIDNVFANVTILGYDLNFLTPSKGLKGFEKSKLTGYIDTSSIGSDKFQANIIVSYLGKKTEKTVDLTFNKKQNNKTYFFIGIVLALVLAWFVWRRYGSKK